MKTLHVKFWGPTSAYQHNKTYCYFYEGDDAAVGKFAVVNSPSSGYALVQIERISDGVESAATKRIVSLVDDTKYKTILDAQKERQKLLSSLTAKDKRRLEIEQFAYLAANDDEARIAIDRLKEIDKLLAS